jgi:hypothetical protein
MNRYLRLVTTEIDSASLRPRGVFGPSYALYRTGDLPADEYEQLKEGLHWFEQNLPLPDRSKIHPKAIFWFKTGGSDLLKRVWQMARILRRHAYEIELKKTSRPGYVIYEDELQLAAVPFADTF